jgi:membrane protease YdiL (CAAX protease family)
MLSERKWELEDLFRLAAWLCFSLFAIMLTQLVAQHVLGKERFHEGSTVWLVFGSLSLHGSILLGTWLHLRLRGAAWSGVFGFTKAPLWRAIALGLLAILLFMPVCTAYFEVLARAGIHLEPQTAVEEFSKAETQAGRVYLAVFAVLLAPLAEEVLFRGIIYSAVRDLGFPRTAFWISAVLFALIHMSVQIFLPILTLGLIFAWLYEKTGNLLSSITAHSAFNALNVVLLLHQEKSPQHLGNCFQFH